MKQIYGQLRQDGHKLVAVLGDLNDTPDSKPLAPLMKTDLRDISEHPSFIDDGHPATYKNGTASSKIDYVLLSPALFKLAQSGGTFRTGVWGNKNGDRWEHYPEMKEEVHAASDHAAIWADTRFDLAGVVVRHSTADIAPSAEASHRWSRDSSTRATAPNTNWTGRPTPRMLSTF